MFSLSGPCELLFLLYCISKNVCVGCDRSVHLDVHAIGLSISLTIWDVGSTLLI